MRIEPGHIAVITGAGSGIGRALARQLSAAGVHVSLCDVSEGGLAVTKASCLDGAPAGTRAHTFLADVSREEDVLAFRDSVLAAHATTSVQLVFNNAGIGGAGSFVESDRQSWERVFNVCWYGVYFGSRAFLPYLMASGEACLINISSVNGFWGSLGPATPVTAYSAAKFAVKGFTEALVTDLRLNAPHVSCAVVMPGHIGTQIAQNSANAEPWTVDRIAGVRRQLLRAGAPVAALDDEAIVNLMQDRAAAFRDSAPMTSEEAATVILNGIRRGDWRILVGDDAERLDAMVRSDPERAYEAVFAQTFLAGRS